LKRKYRRGNHPGRSRKAVRGLLFFRSNRLKVRKQILETWDWEKEAPRGSKKKKIKSQLLLKKRVQCDGCPEEGGTKKREGRERVRRVLYNKWKNQVTTSIWLGASIALTTCIFDTEQHQEINVQILKGGDWRAQEYGGKHFKHFSPFEGRDGLMGDMFSMWPRGGRHRSIDMKKIESNGAEGATNQGGRNSTIASRRSPS